ncbi:MAG: hypothetical protein MZW92_78665 [Comamonadaceae bacterium]|nr:hypothetical protein [Comamonadaceae bacterium]
MAESIGELGHADGVRADGYLARRRTVALRMAVNLSAQQVLRSRRTDSLRAVLDECTGCRPNRYGTGDRNHGVVPADQRERTRYGPAAARSLGITLAIGDFPEQGTPRFMALKLLPIDRIKIDQRSFVAGTPGNADHARTHAAAVIAVGKALGPRSPGRRRRNAGAACLPARPRLRRGPGLPLQRSSCRQPGLPRLASNMRTQLCLNNAQVARQNRGSLRPNERTGMGARR